MLRNRGIRSKILALLVLPFLVLLLAAGLVTQQALAAMGEATRTGNAASAAPQFGQVIAALQAERQLSVRALTGDRRARKALEKTRATVDQRLGAWHAFLTGDADVAGLSKSAQEALERGTVAHSGLSRLRGQFDQGQAEAATIMLGYTDLIATDVAIPQAIADGLTDREQAALMEPFGKILVAAEATMQEQALGLILIADGKATPAQDFQRRLLEHTGEEALQRFYADTEDDYYVTTESHADALNAALQSDPQAAALLSELRSEFNRAGSSSSIRISAADWLKATTARSKQIASVGAAVAGDTAEAAQEIVRKERIRTALIIGISLALIILSIVLALALSRRIIAPLRHLTSVATKLRDELPGLVAEIQSSADTQLVQLPEINVTSADEVGRLAAALRDATATSLEVSAQQAALRASISEMFVNIARRNQALLQRQLAFIDQLERTEENPDALDNLFRLDHLATRMRRNAESLLVLAGVEAGRRLRRPMPLSDVIRTATSEIEHYERVQLELEVDPPLVAHLALPTAHLIAELVENATAFSDPGSAVTVSSALAEDSVRVTITDSGIGMTAEELVLANRRIADPQVADAVSSQRLGFFVVGRLANRLDARVTLAPAAERGLVVRIELPLALFVGGAVRDHVVTGGAAPLAPLPGGAGEPASVLPPAPASPPPAAPAAPAASTPVLPPAPASTPAPAPATAPVSTPPAAPVEPQPAAPFHTPAPVAPIAAPTLGHTPAPAVGNHAAEESPQADQAGLPRRRRPAEPAETAAASGLLAETPAPVPTPAPEPEPVVEDAGNSALFSGFRSRREARSEQPEAPQPPTRTGLPEPGALPKRGEPAPAPIAEVERARATELAPQRPFGQPIPIAPGELGPLAPVPVDKRADAPSTAGSTASQAQTEPPAPEPPAAEPWEMPTMMTVLPNRGLRGGLRRQRNRRNAEPSTPQARLAPSELMEQPGRSGGSVSVPNPRRGGDKSADQPEGAAKAESGITGAANLPPASPWFTPGPDDGGAQRRTPLASEALAELSLLSSYHPASVDQEPPSRLTRRQPAPVPPEVPLTGVDSPETEGEGGERRRRSATGVRSMLSGFHAGVARGRTSPSAHRPVAGPAHSTDQPTSAAPEDRP